MSRFVLIALLFIAAMGSQAQAETPFDGLEGEMSAEERAKSGLDQLSPAQLEYLNGWLKQRFGSADSSALPSAVPSASTLTGAPQQDTGVVVSADAPTATATEADIEAEVQRRVAAEVDRVRAEVEAEFNPATQAEPFDAVITGDFTGWSGKTVFPLNNGQVWRQRHGSSYRHTGDDNRVAFKRNFLGLWQMTVVSTGRSVAVRRID